jgi:uncharacterized protein with PQ loop repeat
MTQVLGALAFALGQLSYVPHVRTAWKAQPGTGGSISGWAIGACSAALWGVYGVALGAWWSVLASVVALGVQSAIALRLRPAARRHQR